MNDASTATLPIRLDTVTRPPAPSALSNALVFGWRAMLKFKHVPEQLFDLVMTPIMFTLLFTFVFGGALAGSPRDYLQFLLPGILVQTVVFNAVYSGMGLSTDLGKGLFGLTPVWWTGEYYRSSDLMWILLVLASTFVRAPCGARTLVPAHSRLTRRRAQGLVKIGRRAGVSIRRDISRPHLEEGPEHDGSVVCAGISLPRVVALVVDR